MARYGDLDSQYFDDSGNPLVNGKIYFYETGTTTPKTTYADVNYTIPNANPVVLTAAGRQPNIFFPGVAKAILTTSSGTQILVRDPVGETDSTFGNPWIASKEYNANDVVLGSDGEFYVSLSSGNVNNNPISTTGYWTFLYSIEWNSGTTYKIGSTVTYNTIVYQSLQNGNLNKNPSSEAAWWVPINLAWVATATYGAGANVVGTNGILYVSQQAGNINHDPSTDNGTWWVTSSAGAATIASALSAGLASVNYEGQWNLLTGPLNTPASVSHSGGTWLLLNNLANVALSEPGVTSDWQRLTGFPYEARASNTIFTGVDNGKIIEYSGTFTQTFTSAVTLGDKWAIYLMNTGTGDITLDPSGAQTIDGLSTLVMYPGEERIVRSNGTNLFSIVIKAFSKMFTASGTFYPPSGYSFFRVGAQGGGGGGGSGSTYTTASTYDSGGGGGGSGGAYIECIRRAQDFTVSHVVTVGAGGSGGGSISTTNTNGIAGTNGGASTLTNIVTAQGGLGGSLGRDTITAAGGAYRDYFSGYTTTYARYVISGSGGGGYWGSGIGGDNVAFGGAGGGGGAGSTTLGVLGTGGTGGARGGSGQAAAGANATTIGGGGGGGNGRNTGAGYAGGNGFLGGGGGGGGGTLFTAGSSSGAGGNGGDGYVYIEGIA
jgi:hypothetical protein